MITRAAVARVGKFQAVVQADWFTAQSLFQRWRPVSRRWRLLLACGHAAERPFRYRDEPANLGSQFAFDQALPAPKRILCKLCEVL